jgi:adenosylcobinamide-GDP ribazoletransferase
MPLRGILVGAVGGLVYWAAAQIWPTSVAVALSMLASASLSGGVRSADLSTLGWVFVVLLKYNSLMALSAASLPFALPANLALGVIMVAGQAASFALHVSVLATSDNSRGAPASVSHADLAFVLLVGFAPAALIGMPGLIGLVAAIAARIAFIAYARRNARPAAAGSGDITRQLAEVCFYLGVLAARAYT